MDKAVFPGVLKQLWLALSADDAIAGFRGSGIVPLDLEKMKQWIVLPDEMGSPVRGDNHTSDSVTPCSAMRKAVRSVLAPAQSNESEEILMNKTKKRTRVQAKTGEVLTSETCARRLLEEQEKCNAKQKDSKKDSGKSLKSNIKMKAMRWMTMKKPRIMIKINQVQVWILGLEIM